MLRINVKIGSVLECKDSVSVNRRKFKLGHFAGSILHVFCFFIVRLIVTHYSPSSYMDSINFNRNHRFPLIFPLDITLFFYTLS